MKQSLLLYNSRLCMLLLPTLGEWYSDYGIVQNCRASSRAPSGGEYRRAGLCRFVRIDTFRGAWEYCGDEQDVVLLAEELFGVAGRGFLFRAAGPAARNAEIARRKGARIWKIGTTVILLRPQVERFGRLQPRKKIAKEAFFYFQAANFSQF